MSVKRFKFVSPGIFLNEIDNSFLPAEREKSGPVVIGRTLRGPAMRPVTVQSQAEFVEMFGAPVPGGRANDVWREGNLQSPMYASYAAMAYLRNNGPVTMVRLLGHEHEDRTASSGESGWNVTNAWGLFLWDSGSASNQTETLTGCLAAVLYQNDVGAPLLSGSRTSVNGGGSPGTVTSGSTGNFFNTGDDREFKMSITNADNGTESLKTSFNFNRRSSKFIRKVLNTNPALLNANLIGTGNRETYFLGQTFENSLNDHLVSSSAGKVQGMWAKLQQGGDGTIVGGDFRDNGGATAGNTGWVFSQHLAANHNLFAPAISSGAVSGGVSRLFKIHALNNGEWESRNLKVSIRDIKYSRTPSENPYGTFTVEVRKASDTDISPIVVESFANCNLNPNSPDYVKRKIGDITLAWNEADRRYTEQGDYENQSRYIRVEMDEDLDASALDPQCLPFGFFGPPRMSTITLATNAAGKPTTSQAMFIDGGPAANGYANGLATGNNTVNVSAPMPVQLQFPKVPTRASSTSGSLSNRKQAYWGVYTLEPGSSKVHNAGWGDLMYPLADGLAVGQSDGLVEESQWAFSLDDVALGGANNSEATWAAGSRAAGNSWSASGSNGSGADGSWSGSLDQGIDKFTMPLWGGFDGLNIQQLDPFSPDKAMDAASTDKSNYAYYSARKAIDTVSDSEVVEMNLACMPGITNNNLNTHLVNVCERRGDALAILDLDGGFKPRANRAAGDAYSTYGGTVAATLTTIEELGINSSYACSYYPWVQIQDQQNGASLWAPPSVVALGTLGSAETQSDVWFAPAGFTRGGLTEGSAGIPVTAVRDRLTSKNRDDLYAANVNPIASFPAEGIVIFGQKTMQVTPSALDRINVRRLMIFVKKEISKMAATTLFEPNVQRTWDGFVGRVNPFLASVQAGLGLDDFKVILDETTTTSDLVDRNIMYAKILLKPTRAIEYIAIDFVITNSGASFED